MRVATRGVLLGALISASACYAYRTVAVAPAAGSRVRIVLASETTVATSEPGRDDVRRSHDGVLEAGGRILAASGDTIAVRLGELRTADGAVPDLTDHVALLPTSRIARIEQRRFQAGTTLLTGVGLSTLALGAFMILVIGTMFKGF